MIKENGQYQQHIHVFRGIAIILIVCAHTIPSLDWSNNPMLGRSLDAVVNQSSIFFFFIAGYLFQHLSQRFSYNRYLLQKLKTVILPYIILSIPALIVFTVFVKRSGVWVWFYDLPIWQQVVLFLITGRHLTPLWFVPTIALFYLAAPIFLYIDRHFKFGYWLILPLIALSTYLGRGGQYGPLEKGLYLLPVYMLGMVFSANKSKSLSMINRWWSVLVIFACIGFSGEIYGWPSPPYWQMPLKISLALIITLLLWKGSHFFGSKLDYIGEVSFGIFFIHAYFISAFKVGLIYWLQGRIYTGEGADVIVGNIFSFLLYVSFVLAFSVVSIWIVKKSLKENSRMLIGA